MPGVFSEVLDVRVVNIEVVVTDKGGVPVYGLGPEAFRLTVDGAEVQIDYFTEVRGGIGVAAESRTERVAGIPGIQPGTPVGTSYLLFIDEVFTLAQDREAVFDEIVAQLPGIQPEDRMAIVAFDGTRLEMLSNWSSSSEELIRTLRRALSRPTLGTRQIAELRRYDRDSAETLQPAVATELDDLERQYVRRLTDTVRKSVSAATATLRSFAQPPGRKVMLLLSGGWPLSPSSYLISTPERQILEEDLAEGPEIFQRLTDVANLLGYSLYTVDVAGISFQAIDMSDRDDTLYSTTSQAEGTLGLVGPRSQLRENQVHAGLKFLATRTGGRALLDEARSGALETVVADTRSYYWLGFTPERAHDESRHELVVEMRSPGLLTRSRSGFLDSSRSSEVAMALESGLLFGNQAFEEGVRLELGEIRRAGRGRVEVPLIVWIPLAEMTFLQGGGEKQVTELELRIALSDQTGQTSEIPPIPLSFAADEPLEEGKYVRYESSLKLRRQDHHAVVAVYEPISGRVFSGSIDIEP
jgi:VWFA-related protein